MKQEVCLECNIGLLEEGPYVIFHEHDGIPDTKYHVACFLISETRKLAERVRKP